MHYFQFEIKEWISNTTHLSLEEEAIYLRLILFYYDSETPIPKENATDTNMVSKDFAFFIRKLRLTSHYETVIHILQEFFTETDEGWIHKRCDAEIERYRAKIEQASKAGKASAQRRLNASSTTVQPIINHKSLIINQESNKKVAKAPSVPDGVSQDLWNEFITHRKRLKAPVTERVVERLIKEATLAKIPLSDVLETIIFKGWRSFEASWIKISENKRELPLSTDQQIEYAYIHEIGGDPSKARFNSYREMKEFILKRRGEK